MLRFILTVLAVMAVLVGGAWWFAPTRPSFLFQTSFFLSFTAIVIYLYLHRVANPGDFVRLYLGMVALKLMVSLGYAVVIAVRDKPGAPGNILYFLLVYLLLTGVEVTFLYRNRR